MRETYNTKQKNALLDCLRSNSGAAQTADELIDAMGENAPSRSTTYRLLSQLCSDGLVRASVPEGARKCVYQLMSGACHSHLHLQCVDCGMLIHLDNATSDNLQNDVMSAAGFLVDEARTVLFGHCPKCAGRAAK